VLNGRSAVRPNASAGDFGRAIGASSRRRAAGMGTVRMLARDFGSMTPACGSLVRSTRVTPRFEVDVLPAKCDQLAQAQPRVHRRRPDRAGGAR